MAIPSDETLLKSWLRETVCWTHWRAYNISEVSYDDRSFRSIKATFFEDLSTLVVQSQSVENKYIRTLHPVPVMLRHAVHSKEVLVGVLEHHDVFECHITDDMEECDLCIPECMIPEPEYAEV
jgi:hypothetical protein